MLCPFQKHCGAPAYFSAGRFSLITGHESSPPPRFYGVGALISAVTRSLATAPFSRKDWWLAAARVAWSDGVEGGLYFYHELSNEDLLPSIRLSARHLANTRGWVHYGWKADVRPRQRDRSDDRDGIWQLHRNIPYKKHLRPPTHHPRREIGRTRVRLTYTVSLDSTTGMDTLVCSICGGLEFRESPVLWPELVTEWQLSVDEVAYINRQQGCACNTCGANLRVIALGNAIRSYAQTPLSLRGAIAQDVFSEWRILDCNGAEGISTEFSILQNYRRVDYPEYDMRSLPFSDGSFDLVVHSDTLEHIEHPRAALEECRRLLSPNGRLCFTVPMIVERLSRSRSGLAPSYHGDASAMRDDFLVHTEYGADAWTSVLRSGFSNVSMTQVEYPSGIALSAWNIPAVHSPAQQSNLTKTDALSGNDTLAENAETQDSSGRLDAQSALG